MAVVARTATTLDHTTAVTLAASPGVAANVPDGDTFPNGGSTWLLMNNTGGSTYTVTVAVEDTVDGLAVTGRVHSIPASSMKLVKLGHPSIYGTTTKVTAENVAVKLLAFAL
jgi:hypothetical protein